MMKKIGLLVAVAALTVGMTSCAKTTPDDVDVLPDGAVSVDFSVENREPVEGYEDGVSYPVVSSVSEYGFTFIDGGSSSCPNEVDDLFVSEKDKTVEVVYKKPEGNVPCTADYRLVEHHVSLHDFTLDSPGSFSFSVNGNPAEVREYSSVEAQ